MLPIPQKRGWRLFPPALIAGVCLGLLSPGAAAQEEIGARDGQSVRQAQRSDRQFEEQRKRIVLELQRRAKATQIYQTTNSVPIKGELLPEPLFRYSDQPRGILDATLWGWVIDGRPIALQKVEVYRGGRENLKRLYCLVSLSTSRIRAQWPIRSDWVATKPGIVWKNLPDGPPPSERKNIRFLQIKRLARRFSATLRDPPAGTQQTMRFLPQPIYGYTLSHSEGDGAIFGFTSNGTNPDALLLIEWQSRNASPATWRYATAGMTQCGLSIELDGKEIWSKDYSYRGATDYENWLFFWAQPRLRADSEEP